jgi:cell division septation protein DedD
LNSNILTYSSKFQKKKIFIILTITLLLLSCLPLFSIQTYADAQATTLFSDGFENGNFSAWTATKSYNTGLTASVQTATVFNGTYAMKVAVVDVAGRESGVCEYKDLGTSYSSIDARVYVQLSAKPQTGSALEILGFSSNGWLPSAIGTRLDIVNPNGTVQWRLNYNNNGWQSALAGSINVNTWYYVEVQLVLGSGTGETHLYVNGTELLTETGLTNTASGNSVRYFSLGVDDETGNNTLNAFFDSVAVTQGYMGPDPTHSPSPTPTPTPSPTPTPTPSPTPTPTPSPTPTPTSTSTPVYREANVTKAIQASWIANDGTVYVGSYQTLYKSLDQGITW